MSWDAVIFNSKQKIRSVEEIDETHLEDTDFDATFERHFENIKVDKTAKTIDDSDFSIVYYPGEPASNTIFNLYGENAIYALIHLAKKHSWQIFDLGLGKGSIWKIHLKTGVRIFRRISRKFSQNNNRKISPSKDPTLIMEWIHHSL